MLRDRKLYIAADIINLTPLHLQIIKIISGVKDKKLQLELLKLPIEATLEEIDTVWRAFVTNNLTSEQLSGSLTHRVQCVHDNDSQCWRCSTLATYHFIVRQNPKMFIAQNAKQMENTSLQCVKKETDPTLIEKTEMTEMTE